MRCPAVLIVVNPRDPLRIHRCPHPPRTPGQGRGRVRYPTQAIADLARLAQGAGRSALRLARIGQAQAATTGGAAWGQIEAKRRAMAGRAQQEFPLAPEPSRMTPERDGVMSLRLARAIRGGNRVPHVQRALRSPDQGLVQNGAGLGVGPAAHARVAAAHRLGVAQDPPVQTRIQVNRQAFHRPREQARCRNLLAKYHHPQNAEVQYGATRLRQRQLRDGAIRECSAASGCRRKSAVAAALRMDCGIREEPQGVHRPASRRHCCHLRDAQEKVTGRGREIYKAAIYISLK